MQCKKNFIALGALLLMSNMGIMLHAQSRVGIGTTNPHASALLDVSGTNGGLLLPRMTRNQRENISNPAAGLMVYESDIYRGIHYYDGNSWMWLWPELRRVVESGKVGWRLNWAYPNEFGDIGNRAIDFSFGEGNSTTRGATGAFAMAWGSAPTASGSSSTAWGLHSIASGGLSTVWGESTSALGSNATAWGAGSTASGNFSTSFGIGTSARSLASVSFGRFNDSISTSNPVSWIATDPLLIVGNGSSANNRSNALTILKNANTGINTIGTPAALLHLRANVANSSWDRHIRLEGVTGGTNYGSILHDGDGMKFRTFGTGEDFFFRNSNNSSTARIFNNGNMTIAGSLTQNSDARLKQDISLIPGALHTLQQIGGYRYHWKSDEHDDKLHYGLLAQQVQEVLPHLVSADEEGTLSVNYIELIPLLLEGMKAQQEKINQLELKVNQLLNR